MYQIISDVAVTHPNLLKDPYRTCRGCFSCWVKKPGVCIYGNDVNDAIIRAKKVIIVSKVTFGGYSSKVKAIIDRSIPLNLPTFKKINHELHHEPRYDRYPELHVIGYDAPTSKEKDTFKKQVKAHSVNYHAPEYSFTFCDKTSVEASLQELIGRLT